MCADPLASVVDLHYHAGPDLYRRRHDVLQAGRHYAAVDGWVVVKSHLGSTAALAWLARREGLPVSGTVVLNPLAGGLSPRTVERAVIEHGPDAPVRLVVHLPTQVEGRAAPPAPAGSLARVPFHPLLRSAAPPAPRLVDQWPAVREVLRAARDLPVLVATGHCDADEVRRVVDEAQRCGLDRLLLTHPFHPLCGMTVEQVSDLADAECTHIEVTVLSRLLGRQDAAAFGAAVRAHPRVVVSSDLGQPGQPDIADWPAIADRWLRDAGLDDADRRRTLSGGPSSLLALG